MNTNRLVTLAAVLGFAAATLFSFFSPSNLVPEAPAEESIIGKWEYMVVAVNVRKLDEVNALGAQGWELTATPSPSMWVMKRPAP